MSWRFSRISSDPGAISFPGVLKTEKGVPGRVALGDFSAAPGNTDRRGYAIALVRGTPHQHPGAVIGPITWVLELRKGYHEAAELPFGSARIYPDAFLSRRYIHLGSPMAVQTRRNNGSKSNILSTAFLLTPHRGYALLQRHYPRLAPPEEPPCGLPLEILF